VRVSKTLLEELLATSDQKTSLTKTNFGKNLNRLTINSSLDAVLEKAETTILLMMKGL
jgi:hypothetical protein